MPSPSPGWKEDACGKDRTIVNLVSDCDHSVLTRILPLFQLKLALELEFSIRVTPNEGTLCNSNTKTILSGGAFKRPASVMIFIVFILKSLPHHGGNVDLWPPVANLVSTLCGLNQCGTTVQLEGFKASSQGGVLQVG